jgi:hypothetical protein
MTHSCTCIVCECRRAVFDPPPWAEKLCVLCARGVHAPTLRPGLAGYLVRRFGWSHDHSQAVAEAVADYDGRERSS